MRRLAREADLRQELGGLDLDLAKEQDSSAAAELPKRHQQQERLVRR